jgi:4-hydroxybenzoate polyprenyltransferase
MTYENPVTDAREGGVLSQSKWWLSALTAFGERVGNALVYSSAYLAAVAMVEAALVMVLLDLRPSFAPIVVGLVTFAVYTCDRLVDVEADYDSKPQQAAFVTRHRDVLYLLASLSYAVAVSLSVFGGPMALALTLLPGMFGVLYTADWIPDVGIGATRLKDVFLVNTVVVALAWSVTLTFLPLAFADATFEPAVGVVFAYFFLRTFVDTELPNVGDVESDRERNVSTVPLVVGVRRTRHALYAVDLIVLGLVAFAASRDVIVPVYAAGLAIGLLYSLGVTSRIGRTTDYERLTLASEFEYLVVGVAIAVPVGL